MKYNIKMDEKQVRILIRALDLFSRIGIGQLERVVEEIKWYMPKKYDPNSSEELDKHIANLKRILFRQPLNGSFSICNDVDVGVEYRESYDMLQVLRHRLAWDKNPEGPKYSVDYDEPIKWVKDYPAIEIKKEENREE